MSLCSEPRFEHLADRATHDPLTGTLNRMELFEQVRHALTRLERAASSMAALFIDFDDFKEVNDRLGHEIGDQVLSTLAKRLRASVRIGDLLGRYGGDEFVAVCEELVDARPGDGHRRTHSARRQPHPSSSAMCRSR